MFNGKSFNVILSICSDFYNTFSSLSEFIVALEQNRSAWRSMTYQITFKKEKNWETPGRNEVENLLDRLPDA